MTVKILRLLRRVTHSLGTTIKRFALQAICQHEQAKDLCNSSLSLLLHQYCTTPINSVFCAVRNCIFVTFVLRWILLSVSANTIGHIYKSVSLEGHLNDTDLIKDVFLDRSIILKWIFGSIKCCRGNSSCFRYSPVADLRISFPPPAQLFGYTEEERSCW